MSKHKFTDYYLVVNLDERGDYSASVYDPNDKSVYEIESAEQVKEMQDDGYLKGKPDEDLDLLTKYLMDTDMIPNGSQVYSEDVFEDKIREQYEEEKLSAGGGVSKYTEGLMDEYAKTEALSFKNFIDEKKSGVSAEEKIKMDKAVEDYYLNHFLKEKGGSATSPERSFKIGDKFKMGDEVVYIGEGFGVAGYEDEIHLFYKKDDSIVKAISKKSFNKFIDEGKLTPLKSSVGSMATGGKVGFWDKLFGKKPVEPRKINYIERSELNIPSSTKEFVKNQRKEDGFSGLEFFEYIRQAGIRRDDVASKEGQKDIIDTVCEKLGIADKHKSTLYNQLSGYLDTPYEMGEDGKLSRYRAGYGKGGEVTKKPAGAKWNKFKTGFIDSAMKNGALTKKEAEELFEDFIHLMVKRYNEGEDGYDAWYAYSYKYAVEYRDMHSAIHNIIVTKYPDKAKAEEILEAVNVIADSPEEGDMEMNYDILNRIGDVDDTLEINFRHIKEINGKKYWGDDDQIMIINTGVVPDLYAKGGTIKKSSSGGIDWLITG
jgi:hypothetical protein